MFEDIFKAGYLNVYTEALAMMDKQGQLTPKMRELLLDWMLLDYIGGLWKKGK
jgi:hypothetical protein